MRRRFQLEPRDCEILRTLARLRFVTGPEVASSFFTTDSAAFRRLRRLRNMNFIRRHEQGVAGELGHFAWRITTVGIDAVEGQYSAEVIPPGLDDRLQRQSLFDIEHRAALNRLYLGLICAGRDEMGATCAEVRQWMAIVRHRADQLDWQVDGDVVVHFRDLADEHRLVPDATVTTKLRKLRLFIELDRSRKTLGRIETNLRRYAAFLHSAYGTNFPDGRPAQLVYVVRSEARKTGIARLARAILGDTSRALVLLAGAEATAWLAKTLLDEDRAALHATAAEGAPASGPSPEVPEDLRVSIHEMIAVSSTLLKSSPAPFAEISKMHPDAFRRWKQILRTLHQRIEPEATHG